MSRLTNVWIGAIVLTVGVWVALGAGPATTTTAPSTTTQGADESDLGPDVVMLRELVALYEPVPFNHRGHARMAEMWDGCTTCHHRSPDAATRPATEPGGEPIATPTGLDRHRQDNAKAIPACKSCHEVAVEATDVRMPGLKGAYHRQCLNCHKEWMHANACVICHQPRNAHRVADAAAPTRDDIVGRMHPPIPEPEVAYYKARFTPAAGGNVAFRHKEHTQRFGFRCATCHHRDNCSHCHDPKADTVSQKPVKPGRTWAASHGPCVGCHQQDRCGHCHYEDGKAAPVAFDHATTGQLLDEKHSKLTCTQCHLELKLAGGKMTCGNGNCHKPEKAIAFPTHRPGLVVSTRPATAPIVMAQPTTRPAPTTRATVIRIRR